MLLAIAPFAALFLIATGVFGLTLLANLRKKDEPGAAVAIEFLPEDSDWVIKSYAQKGGFYEGHVYHSGEFMGRRGGFTTIPRAIGWGFGYARDHAHEVS